MSTNQRERSKMSSEADIEFMENACLRIAEARAKGQSMGQRIDAVLRALRTREWSPTENRVYELIKGRARRVDGFEKDRAREVIQEIEAENESRKNTEHLNWLQEQIDRHRESGQDIRGPHILALERILSAARNPSSAVEVRTKTAE